MDFSLSVVCCYEISMHVCCTLDQIKISKCFHNAFLQVICQSFPWFGLKWLGLTTKISWLGLRTDHDLS